MTIAKLLINPHLLFVSEKMAAKIYNQNFATQTDTNENSPVAKQHNSKAATK